MYYRLLEEKELFITEGTRPWWHLVIAALGYTAAITALYFGITVFNADGRFLAGMAFVITFSIMTGIRFSLVLNYHFDFESSLYKIEKRVGPIGFGKWKSFEELGYIAVYNKTLGMYDVNLWYDGNQYFTVSSFDDMTKALQMGEDLARKLKLNLLDAAGDPHKSKWIDLD